MTGDKAKQIDMYAKYSTSLGHSPGQDSFSSLLNWGFVHSWQGVYITVTPQWHLQGHHKYFKQPKYSKIYINGGSFTKKYTLF